jgi:hypothetical protein
MAVPSVGPFTHFLAQAPSRSTVTATRPSYYAFSAPCGRWKHRKPLSTGMTVSFCPGHGWIPGVRRKGVFSRAIHTWRIGEGICLTLSLGCIRESLTGLVNRLAHGIEQGRASPGHEFVMRHMADRLPLLMSCLTPCQIVSWRFAVRMVSGHVRGQLSRARTRSATIRCW